jgi:hypothetical protein
MARNLTIKEWNLVVVKGSEVSLTRLFCEKIVGNLFGI